MIVTSLQARDRAGPAVAMQEDTIHGFVGMASVLPAGAQAMTLICDRVRRTVSAAR